METSMPQAASSTSVGFNAATGTDVPIRALVLCSGGVDSTTLLAMAVKRYGAQNVYALSISYGQRHDKEIFAAQAVAGYYGVEQRFLDLSAIFADSNCSLLAHSTQDVPEECYAEQLSETDGKPVSTYVPFRNGLFLSSAASMALSLGCSVLYYGAHHDDWAGNAYPDCSQEFVDAMNCAKLISFVKDWSLKFPMSLRGRAMKVEKSLVGFAAHASIAFGRLTLTA